MYDPLLRQRRLKGVFHGKRNRTQSAICTGTNRSIGSAEQKPATGPEQQEESLSRPEPGQRPEPEPRTRRSASRFLVQSEWFARSFLPGPHIFYHLAVNRTSD